MTTHSPTSPTSPSDPAADPALEASLRALTTYTGEPTTLWKSALESDDAARIKSRSYLSMAITIASVAALLLLAVGIFVPAIGKSRSSVGSVAMDGPTAPSSDQYEKTASAASSIDHRRKDDFETRAGLISALRSADSTTRVAMPSDQSTAVTPSRDGTGNHELDSPADSTRSVIRKAAIELAVPSTREAFAKCQHLLRIDLGEFVEGSSLTGQAEESRGQLTLRVAASRLDEVMNALRAMGKVDSENASGDDVSNQVVDLDARLRNERTVEAEILKLLESRKDAQLKDVLDLRDKLATLRSGIERLQGQRDTLGRQISLATVLVILRPDNAPKPEPKPASIFDGFSNEMSAAWTSGLMTLTQTISFLIRILVGGLVWWLLLLGAVAIARRALRRWLPDPAAVPRTA